MNPAALLILTGPPGAGKTTVARLLAEASTDKIVHLHTDDFYAAIRQGFVAPWLEASDDQNRAVTGAIAASACAFAGEGYRVIIDGVVGPWFLPIYRQAGKSTGLTIDYVVLRPTRDLAVARARDRATAPLGDYPPHIFEGFANLGDLEGHVIEIGGQDASEVAAAVRGGTAAGRYRV